MPAVQANGIDDMVIKGILPWCLTTELYAVLAHDGSAALGAISAPTLITFGRHDQVTSTGFADALTTGIAGSELSVFEDCSHAPIYENVEAFSERTLAFLRRHSASR